eukprot:SAG31_NODE_1107_length_9877_cov_4.000102_12_plen_447_part_00
MPSEPFDSDVQSGLLAPNPSTRSGRSSVAAAARWFAAPRCCRSRPSWRCARPLRQKGSPLARAQKSERDYVVGVCAGSPTCAPGLTVKVPPCRDLSAEGHGGKVVLHVAPPADVGAVAAVDCDGSATRPFRSVAAARDALRSLQPLPHGGALVLLHEGMHAPFVLQGKRPKLCRGYSPQFRAADRIARQLLCSNAQWAGSIDSGRPEAPIVYAAAPGEHAMVSGARPIPPSAFKRWGGGSGLLRADLAPLGFTKSDLGGMQYPASDGTMSFGSCQHDKAELFWGGDAMTLARFPNKAADGTWQFLHADLAGTPGGTWFLMKDGPNATKIQKWCAVPDSNLGHQLPTISNSSGVPVLNSGHRRAAGEKNAWLHGYWEFGTPLQRLVLWTRSSFLQPSTLGLCRLGGFVPKARQGCPSDDTWATTTTFSGPWSQTSTTMFKQAAAVQP